MDDAPPAASSIVRGPSSNCADGQAEFGRVEGEHFGVGDIGRAPRVAAAFCQLAGAIEGGEQIAAQHWLRPGPG
jgi:hypothetical protein